MKKFAILLLASFIVLSATAQQRLLTWAPEFAADNSSITITVDCNKGSQGLLNYEGGNSNNVYVHIGVITSVNPVAGAWQYVPFSWGSTTAAAKATPLGNNKYSYTITNIRAFFGVPAGETILKVATIFRNATGSLKQVNSDGSDMYVPVYGAGEFAVRMNLPPFEPRFIPWLEPITAGIGQQIGITGVSSQNANLSLTLNGNNIGTANGLSTISASPTLSTSCDQKVILTGTNGPNTAKDSFSFYIPPSTVVENLPAGVQDGINYLPGNTSVTLVLFAPGKTSAVVIGDFSNWQSSCTYQMKKTPDGNRFFITLTGLTSGTIYKFQYVVDGTITIADPYSELILDPWNDQYISANTFPNMPAYPTGLTSGVVGTFQTAAPQYTWSNSSYSRPDKKSIVVYELLLRDFLASGNWQTLTDTLNYLQRLGVNAIEVMPFNEFDGNSSWGYNPDFFFAPDKAYGTKNNLKRFIDSAHSKGMAVIMDAVLNHATGLCPLVQLWWNSANNTPAANSPFFNVTSTHPFSVFNDFNHESEATKYFVSRYIRHWLTEYKLDGFRWDLSKGFTQHVSTNVGSWNTYDPSRVAIWNRYYDSTQAVSNGSYCILEHLGNDDEEAALSNIGMLLWGKMTDQYNQNTMGFASNSDINRAFALNRAGWSKLHLVTYAESHDEERIMYKNLTFGNSTNAAHNVKNLQIALSRTEAMMPFLLLIPGPKMLWEFGELGYDKSIFMCEDGTVPQPYGTDNCKLAPKPPLWNYYSDAARKKIFTVVSGLNALRKAKPNAFLSNAISGNLGSTLLKFLIINHPDLSVVAMANFDVTAQNITVTFPSAGTWTNYFTQATYSATGAAQTINLQPGEYRVYVNQSNCTTSAPSATTPVVYCQGANANVLTASGSGLLWYTTATGGTGSSTAPAPSTANVGNTSYYVSQTVGGCEGPRTEIVVTVSGLPSAPTATTTINYCLGDAATALNATGSNLLWFTTATGGTGTSTAPTPATTSVGSTIYYVSQTANGCESPRTAITVNVTATPTAPTATSPINYCQNATATPLIATGSNLLWYANATGGTGSSTAPIPSTATVGSVSYYVSQTQSCGESPRTEIVVVTNAIPSAPAVTANYSYCQNVAATVLTATGSNLLWYTSASGGQSSATPPTPLTNTAGSTNYYVSQTVNGCESPRAMITVSVNAAPSAPNVTSTISYCQNATATPLIATGSNLLWYANATGGTGSATAPTPSTANLGNTNYYVSQTANGCESPRAMITVTINAAPAAPAVTAEITYCQNATATPLTANGNSLLWYLVPTGGTGSFTAPTPSTTTAGVTMYFVSQFNNCGESPRATITVTINATPASPSGLTVTNITATSATLSWTGSTGSFYYVQYKESTSSSWVTAASAITITTLDISNLLMGKTYDWRVSANCDNTNSGNYAASQFGTSSRNNQITNIKNGIGIKISPNPVMGSNAIIDYSVSENGKVEIAVVNSVGQVVKKLEQANRTAGQYSFTITNQLDNLASGAYYLKLTQNKKHNSILFVKVP